MRRGGVPASFCRVRNTYENSCVRGRLLAFPAVTVGVAALVRSAEPMEFLSAEGFTRNSPAKGLGWRNAILKLGSRELVPGSWLVIIEKENDDVTVLQRARLDLARVDENAVDAAVVLNGPLQPRTPLLLRSFHARDSGVPPRDHS